MTVADEPEQRHHQQVGRSREGLATISSMLLANGTVSSPAWQMQSPNRGTTKCSAGPERGSLPPFSVLLCDNHPNDGKYVHADQKTKNNCENRFLLCSSARASTPAAFSLSASEEYASLMRGTRLSSASEV